MFGQILYTQAKWTRASVAVLAVVAFAMPAGLWRAARQGYLTNYTAMEVMSGFSFLGPALGVLAFFCGFMMVAQPWAVDGAARHVYPLSLPISWKRYVAMRFGAGALLLLVPALTLWLGCLLVLALVPIPDTLQAYPTTLAFRFLLGALVSYAGIFAVQYLSGRKAAHLLLGVIVVTTAAAMIAELSGNGRLLILTVHYLFDWPGPFAVFGAEWMLIDV
jgi:hypothetical protein